MDKGGAMEGQIKISDEDYTRRVIVDSSITVPDRDSLPDSVRQAYEYWLSLKGDRPLPVSKDWGICNWFFGMQMARSGLNSSTAMCISS